MTDNEKKILFGFGLLGIGVLLFMSRKKLSELATAALDEANDLFFRAALSTNARPYADVVRQVAREQGRDPLLLAALVDREDPWWDPNIVSEDGGHGLGQITSDTAWIESSDWRDPYTNLTKAAQMLGVELDFFASKFPDDPALATQYALAAYNRGRTKVWAGAQRGEPPDTGTTNSYATGVWAIYNRLAGAFSAGLGQV
jgi:membrane-bound lytic murein transglycosylase MltF